MAWASNPDDFALKVRGVQSTSDSWGGEGKGAESDEQSSEFVDRF
jgi:hypothetical protein